MEEKRGAGRPTIYQNHGRVPFEEIDFDKAVGVAELFNRYADKIMKKRPDYQATVRKGFVQKLVKFHRGKPIDIISVQDFNKILKTFFEIAVRKIGEGKVLYLYELGWLYMSIKPRQFKKKSIDWGASHKLKMKCIANGNPNPVPDDYLVYKHTDIYYWLTWKKPLFLNINNRIKYYDLKMPHSNKTTGLGIIFDMIRKYPELTNNYFREFDEDN